MQSKLLFMSFACFLCYCFLTSCGEGKTDQLEIQKREYQQQINEVDTIILNPEDFKHEIISNGKLRAKKKGELKFNVNGQLKTLGLKNGDGVRQNQVIAVLDQFQYLQNLEQARINLKKSHMDLQNTLIGQGYNLSTDSVGIPEQVYEYSAIRSGYLAAVKEMKTADYNLSQTVLKAPFNGKLADIKFKTHEQVTSGEIFCNLIDDSIFEVEFYLIESEVGQVNLRDQIVVKPFAIKLEVKGNITEINPVVNEKGMVLIRAELTNPGSLMEGMNVEVSIQKEIPQKLVVPKSAVVLRQNQEVLFKYVAGKAFWTYVKTEHENSSTYAVIADPEKGGELNPGDTVIVSGNLNLAHESDVEVK